MGVGTAGGDPEAPSVGAVGVEVYQYPQHESRVGGRASRTEGTTLVVGGGKGAASEVQACDEHGVSGALRVRDLASTVAVRVAWLSVLC